MNYIILPLAIGVDPGIVMWGSRPTKFKIFKKIPIYIFFKSRYILYISPQKILNFFLICQNSIYFYILPPKKTFFWGPHCLASYNHCNKVSLNQQQNANWNGINANPISELVKALFYYESKLPQIDEI